MLLAYDSKTGNVKRFVDSLDVSSLQIDESTVMDEPFVLITYTTGFGQVPVKVQDFLQNNHHHMRAVAASGNRNWGDSFAKSAHTISSQYEVPILHKFEMSGTSEDINIFKERMNELECTGIK